jgi:hypothetical protein
MHSEDTPVLVAPESPYSTEVLGDSFAETAIFTMCPYSHNAVTHMSIYFYNFASLKEEVDTVFGQVFIRDRVLKTAETNDCGIDLLNECFHPSNASPKAYVKYLKGSPPEHPAKDGLWIQTHNSFD